MKTRQEAIEAITTTFGLDHDFIASMMSDLLVRRGPNLLSDEMLLALGQAAAEAAEIEEEVCRMNSKIRKFRNVSMQPATPRTHVSPAGELGKTAEKM